MRASLFLALGALLLTSTGHAARVLQQSTSAIAVSTGGTAAAAASSDQAGKNSNAVAVSTKEGEIATDLVKNGKNQTSWDMAPACPTSVTYESTVPDSYSPARRWGYDALNRRSCAYRMHAPGAFESAPDCPNTVTMDQTVEDQTGRRWGWANGASCAYRPHYDGAFASAAPCSFAPTLANAQADSTGRLWSWENKRSCAFKDSKGKPLTVSAQ